MIVIYSYYNDQPECRAALAKYAPDAIYVDNSVSDYAYWQGMRDHWGKGEALVNIEGDKELSGWVLPQFEACTHTGWCSFGYPMNRNKPLDNGTGCVKFSVALQEKYPDFMPRCNWGLDGIVNRAFGPPHVHYPRIRHFHLGMEIVYRKGLDPRSLTPEEWDEIDVPAPRPEGSKTFADRYLAQRKESPEQTEGIRSTGIS